MSDMAEHEVFNGVNHCLVQCCCDDEVLQEEVYQAPAHRYLVEAPKRVSQIFICANCKRELASRVKPPRPVTPSTKKKR